MSHQHQWQNVHQGRIHIVRCTFCQQWYNYDVPSGDEAEARRAFIAVGLPVANWCREVANERSNRNNHRNQTRKAERGLGI